MKQSKQYMYSTITGDSGITALVADRVHFQADTEMENDWDDKFPMITLYRIGGSMPEKTIKRIDRFQVTAWDKTNLGAEEIAQLLIELLKNRKDQTVKNVLMLGGFVDLFDPQTKAHGVAITIDLIMADNDV